MVENGSSIPSPADSDEPAGDPAIRPAWDMVTEAKKQIDNLSPAEVKSELDAVADQDGDGEGSGTTATVRSTVVVDIRDHRELYLKGKIPGAVHAPRGMLEFWVDPSSEYHRPVFDPSRRYILYCAAGGRSALAAKAMKDMGYPDVAHLEPGFGGWEAAGYDVEDVKTTSRWVPRPD